MKLTAVTTDLFLPQADLPAFILRHIPHAQEGTVLAVASKLLAYWKGKRMPYCGQDQFETFIQQESEWALKTPLAWMTIKDGMVMTNAGIDASNADGNLLFLPPDLYTLAAQLRIQLQQAWQVKRVGVVITDSHILPLRAGVIATAVAYAGFKGVRDMRGKKDLFGRALEVTQINVADSLATAAALCMGEGAERQPLCVIEEAPVEFVDEVPAKEIKYSVENDLYTPLFRAAGYRKKGE